MAEDKSEKSKDEEAVKEFCQRRAAKKAADVADFLEAVGLDDNYRDKKLVKVKIWDDKAKNEYHYEYEEQEVPVPVNVRVTAAKTWKEMIFDKTLGDVKEKAKDTKDRGVDMKHAIEAIAKSKAAEKNGLKEEEI